MNRMETTRRQDACVTTNEQPARHEKRKEVVEAQAQALLRASNYLAIRHVSCEFHEGVLTLRGSVPSYYLKQVAQSVVISRLKGVAIINNRLEVPQPTPTG
jgi:osmotically-inducible protein OsmY